jgi:tRNA A37 threonylcarbamoyladenosine modification protein TsaB
VLVVFDTRRKDLYAQLFLPAGLEGPASLAPAGPARVLAPAALPAILPAGQVVLAGDGAGLALAVCAAAAAGRVSLASSPSQPDAAQVAMVAAKRVRGEIAPCAADPLYLRRPEATPAGRVGHPSR